MVKAYDARSAYCCPIKASSDVYYHAAVPKKLNSHNVDVVCLQTNATMITTGDAFCCFNEVFLYCRSSLQQNTAH